MDKPLYNRHRFPAFVIKNAVWLYCRNYRISRTAAIPLM
jgi:hypothetical protein